MGENTGCMQRASAPAYACVPSFRRRRSSRPPPAAAAAAPAVHFSSSLAWQPRQQADLSSASGARLLALGTCWPLPPSSLPTSPLPLAACPSQLSSPAVAGGQPADGTTGGTGEAMQARTMDHATWRRRLRAPESSPCAAAAILAALRCRLLHRLRCLSLSTPLARCSSADRRCCWWCRVNCFLIVRRKGARISCSCRKGERPDA